MRLGNRRVFTERDIMLIAQKLETRNKEMK
jgi:hypothetical protein